MSHSVAIKTQFKNQKAMFKAFEDLGWTIKQNSKLRTYGYDEVRNKIYSLAAINPKQGYDIGIEIDGEEVKLIADMSYSPAKIKETLGADFCELKKKYVINVTKEHYDDVTIVEMMADGSLIIEADDGQ